MFAPAVRVVVKLRKEMCVDKLSQALVTSAYGLVLRQAGNSLTGPSAMVGRKEKESTNQGSGEGWGKCGPGFI